MHFRRNVSDGFKKLLRGLRNVFARFQDDPWGFIWSSRAVLRHITTFQVVLGEIYGFSTDFRGLLREHQIG